MNMKKTVHAHIIGWNVADTIEFTIKHYRAFCEEVFFYDNHSTDGTGTIATHFGAQVKTFGEPGVLSDQHYLDVKNHCWKGSKADLVIVVDDDEIIEECQGWQNFHGTIAKTQGFEVYDFGMPHRYFWELRMGIPNPNYSKAAIWNPHAIKEINYVFGCHQAKPEGDVKWSDLYYGMLHYRSIGGPERLINRHAAYRAKNIAEINKRWGLGSHYWNQTDEERRTHWLQEYDRRMQAPGHYDGHYVLNY